MISIETGWQLLVAMLCGALIGMEREFVGQHEPRRLFAGVRTLTFVGLLGALSTQLGGQLGWWVPGIAFAALVVLVGISHFMSQAEDPGLTTEVVSLLTFLIGVTIAQGGTRVAVAVTIVITALLSIKKPLHEFARRLSEADVNATIKFAIVSLVILPLLPDRGFGPYGVLNPFAIWLLVVLISGISFLGYVLIQFVGPTRGLVLTGLLGGLVSSTAVTLSAAQRSRTSEALGGPLGLSALIASTVMFPRILVIVAVVQPVLLKTVGWPLAGMSVVGFVASAVLARRVHLASTTGVKFTNPFRLSGAISFGVLFVLLLLIVRFAEASFGAMGVYITGLIAGSTDVDAITLSMARLTAAGTPGLVAARTIILAALANTLVKIAILWLFGNRAVARPATPGYAVVIITGVLALVAMR